MYIKCDVVLDELKPADIAEKHVTYKTLCNLRILNKFTMYCEIRKRKSHLKCSKSDYKESVRNFREEKQNKKTNSIIQLSYCKFSIYCHPVKLIQNLQHDAIIKSTLYDNYVIIIM